MGLPETVKQRIDEISWVNWGVIGQIYSTRTLSLWRKKGTSRGITIPDIKFYYRATVMKISWYRHKNRKVDQWNWIKDPDINLNTYEHLVFDKELKLYSG